MEGDLPKRDAPEAREQGEKDFDFPDLISDRVRVGELGLYSLID